VLGKSVARVSKRVGVAVACGVLFGTAAPAMGAVGNFDGGDGDQGCVAGGPLDWACPSGSVLRADDAALPADNVFAGGSKELEPKGWSFTTSDASDKTDLQTVWRTTVEPEAGRSFLNLAVKRAVDSGDTHISFELNQQRTTWINGLGTTIPCRTTGDVLVSYSISSAATVSLYKWQGTEAGPGCPDGAKGIWVPGPGAPATFQAALNGAPIANVLPITPPSSSFPAGTFAEASLDMATIAEHLNFSRTCEFFTGLQAHSRASSEITSTMKDIVSSIAISVVACDPDPDPDPNPDPDPDPDPDVTAPAAPSISGGASCLTSRSVSLSGTAEPDAQVILRDGAESMGLVQADPAGDWSTTLNDVPDGSHSYTAVAVDADGNVSDASGAVSVFVDATPDAAPAITSPANGSTVTSGPLVVSGTAEPDTMVAVSDGATFLGAAVADGTGAWQYTIDGPSLGAHDLSATATDGCNASGSIARSTVNVTDGSAGGGGGDTGGGDTGGGGTGGDTGDTGGDTGGGTGGDTGGGDMGGGAGGGDTTGTGAGGDAATGGGGTGTPTTDAGSTPTDAAVVTTASAALASLPLGSLPVGGLSSECVGKAFTTFVTDKKHLLSRVIFKVDGKTVATIKKRDKQRRFIVRIDPRKYRAGNRKLTATLVPRSSTTKRSTVTRRFRRCDSCKSRRGFNIRLARPNGEKLRSATVFVNNRKVRTVRGKRLTAPVRLVGLPKGTYKVRIRAVTASGRVVTSTRTYRTCAKKIARKLATKK